MITPSRMQVFWLMWIVANAIGMLGYLLNLIISSHHGTLGLDAAMIAGSAVIGASLGIAQWLILYCFRYRNIWWIPASILGWALGRTVSVLLTPYVGSGFVGIIADAAIAILTSVLQTFILRRWSSRAGWWILVYVAGWMTSSGFEFFIGPPAGAIFGAITGLPLVWILQRAVQQPERSTPSSVSSV